MFFARFVIDISPHTAINWIDDVAKVLTRWGWLETDAIPFYIRQYANAGRHFETAQTRGECTGVIIQSPWESVKAPDFEAMPEIIEDLQGKEWPYRVRLEFRKKAPKPGPVTCRDLEIDRRISDYWGRRQLQSRRA